MSKHNFSSGSSVSAYTLGKPEVVDLAQELRQLDRAGASEQHQQVAAAQSRVGGIVITFSFRRTQTRPAVNR